MKYIAQILILLSLLISHSAKADQLQVLAKKDAKQAKKMLRKWGGAMLYCGCCQNDIPVKVQFEKVKIKQIEGDELFEVHITYVNDLGQTVTKSVDLAYVWLSRKSETKTLGEWLNLKHDPCERLP